MIHAQFVVFSTDFRVRIRILDSLVAETSLSRVVVQSGENRTAADFLGSVRRAGLFPCVGSARIVPFRNDLLQILCKRRRYLRIRFERCEYESRASKKDAKKGANDGKVDIEFGQNRHPPLQQGRGGASPNILFHLDMDSRRNEREETGGWKELILEGNSAMSSSPESSQPGGSPGEQSSTT